MAKNFKIIVIEDTTKEALTALKLSKRDSYNEVIKRLLPVPLVQPKP